MVSAGKTRWVKIWGMWNILGEEVFGDAGVDWATYGYDPQMPLTDVDWVGVETFTIVGSEVESIPLGCTYSAVVSGVYLGEF